MKKIKKVSIFGGGLVLLVAGAFLAIGGAAAASHSWNGYHWARTENPFTLKFGDSVSGVWDGVLATASVDWSLSSVLNTEIVPGLLNKSCKGVTGRVEVCNSKYGWNGWLGLAQVWVTGGVHITKGAVKLNDTYFNTSSYNSTAWRNLVACQEIGHALGLDHQDENFDNANLGTCMDYTSNPATNQHPNAHDYEELANIYAHLDSFSTLVTVAPSGKNRASLGGFGNDSVDDEDFGKVLRKDGRGRPAVYGRDLGNGDRLFTFIYWAD